MTKILTDKSSVIIAAQQTEQESNITLAVSYRGFEFDTLENEWTLNRNITVDLRFLDDFNEAVAEDIRETLLYFAENYSAPHVRNLIDNLKVYLKITKAAEFSES